MILSWRVQPEGLFHNHEIYWTEKKESQKRLGSKSISGYPGGYDSGSVTLRKGNQVNPFIPLLSAWKIGKHRNCTETWNKAQKVGVCEYMNLLKSINRILDYVFTDIVIKILFVILLLLIPVFLFYGNPLYLVLLWAIFEYLDYRNRKLKGKDQGEEWKWWWSIVGTGILSR